MRRAFCTLAALIIIADLLGCGGGGGAGGGTSANGPVTAVSITASGLSPRDFSLSRGSTLTWTNNTPYTVKVVSGGVDGRFPPVPPSDGHWPVVNEFTIEEDGSFTPDSKNLSLGWYEVGWVNSSGRTVTLRVLDETGVLIVNEKIANGEVYGAFLNRVGTYTFHLASAPRVTGSIVLSGIPWEGAGSKFESPYLSPGQTYSTVIDTEYSYQDYHVIDQANKSESHIEARITMR